MADRSVKTESLVGVADKIREKGNTSDSLVFPEGFISAIDVLMSAVDALGAVNVYVANYLQDDVLVDCGLIDEYDGTIVS